MKRKLHYNSVVASGEQLIQRVRWTFAILNEPREIERLEQKLFRQLYPADDLIVHYESLVEGSGGLHCKILSVSSDVGGINPKEVYDSPNFKRDRDLFEREEDCWESYVARFVRS